MAINTPVVSGDQRPSAASLAGGTVTVAPANLERRTALARAVVAILGGDHMRGYFAAARESLTPGARFLNHGIATAERRNTSLAHRSDPRRNSRFVERYVFPDGELVPVELAISVARDDVGFELLDVQLLRPHYALTLRAWVDRLERSWDAAIAAAGDEVARTWRLYMSGARLGFERGELDVAQLLLARPLADGSPAPRPLRPWW